MYFLTYGPFDIPLKKRQIPLDRRDHLHRELWDSVNEGPVGEEGLASACGCYIFALQNAKTLKPWYIGKAGKQTFRQECFNKRNIKVYNEILEDTRGRAKLYLVARLTDGNKFSSPAAGKHGWRDIDFLEKFLIGKGLDANNDLANLRDTGLRRNVVFEGVLNSSPGRRETPTQHMHSMFSK